MPHLRAGDERGRPDLHRGASAVSVRAARADGVRAVHARGQLHLDGGDPRGEGHPADGQPRAPGQGQDAEDAAGGDRHHGGHADALLHGAGTKGRKSAIPLPPLLLLLLPFV